MRNDPFWRGGRAPLAPVNETMNTTSKAHIIPPVVDVGPLKPALVIPSKQLETRRPSDIGFKLPGLITPTGLHLDRGLPFVAWQRVGDQLVMADSGSKWWIGDWLNYGEKTYGETYSQELQDKFGVGYEALAHYKWMSNQYEFCTRVQNVSWAHHRLLASKKFSPKERATYLRAARLYALPYDEFDRFIVRHTKKKRLAHLPKPEPWNGAAELDTVKLCDIDELNLEPHSIDLVFTDPPYDEASLPLYESLGRLARRVLKPGAYLMTYSGHMFMPRVMEAVLYSGLEWVWCYAVGQPDSKHEIFKTHIWLTWRPVLCFKQPGDSNMCEWSPDMVIGTRDKKLHAWQQQMEPALRWIAAYTLPEAVVLDPFVGSGTTVDACRQLGRHYLAFDKDPDAVKETLNRLKGSRK